VQVFVVVDLPFTENIRNQQPLNMIIIDQSVETIKGLTDKHLWIIVMSLAKRAGQGQKSFPSYSTIGKDCQMSRRSAIRYVKEMFELGIVSKQSRQNQRGDQTSNIYGFNPAFKSLATLKFEGVESDETSDNLDTTPSDKSVTTLVTEMTPPSDKSVTLTTSQGNYKNISLSAPAQKIENLKENEDWKSEILNHPLFPKSQDQDFPNLDQNEIEYTLDLYQSTLKGRQPLFSQAVSWLKNRSVDKVKVEKIKASPPPKTYQTNHKKPETKGYKRPEGYWNEIQEANTIYI